ncbi:phosphotransferase enzyme family-domain-containing protein [Mycena galericulata]|nr:phosphotransferase enzyme family-domain-containing protein [Mycena galericulata]
MKMIEPFFAFVYKQPNDERIEIDLEPLGYDAWSLDETDAPDNSQWFSIIQHVGSLLNGKPVVAKTRKPFDNRDTVMEVRLDDGRSVFARVVVYRHDDPSPAEMWKRGRLFSEHSVLRWLEANMPSLPVPRVLAFDNVNDLLVTTLMDGLDANHAYPRLSPSAKEHSVTSWATISVRMFRIPVPQRFGGIFEDLLVQSASYLSLSPEHSFETDETTSPVSFFTKAISGRRARSLEVNNAEDQEMLSSRLDRLLEGLKPLIALAEETSYMSRFSLTHRDPRPDNVMLDETSGEVIGIVDWEYNGCMPACLSVGYPTWIRPPIVESPIFRKPDNKMISFFNEPRAERNRLCDLYEKTVKELDEEYYNCIVQGTRLRDALAWIEHWYSDHNGSEMELWVEEHLFGEVESNDHRCA